jgi:lipoyl(octanoyl) transferase
MAVLDVVDLGRRPYGDVLGLQRELCRRRVAGEESGDLLLLVEHEPVYTLGRGTKETSLPVPRAELAGRGADVFEVERGGDVTFHGPGQLVGYPILDLRRHRMDLHWYLREVEGALIDGLAMLGVRGERRQKLTGVWSGDRKIASIGIHVKQWITIHGFALNVTTDLGWFEHIVPCGIDQVRMTSVGAELGAGLPAAELWAVTRDGIIAAFAARFGLEPRAGVVATAAAAATSS